MTRAERLSFLIVLIAYRYGVQEIDDSQYSPLPDFA